MTRLNDCLSCIDSNWLVSTSWMTWDGLNYWLTWNLVCKKLKTQPPLRRKISTVGRAISRTLRSPWYTYLELHRHEKTVGKCIQTTRWRNSNAAGTVIPITGYGNTSGLIQACWMYWACGRDEQLFLSPYLSFSGHTNGTSNWTVTLLDRCCHAVTLNRQRYDFY